MHYTAEWSILVLVAENRVNPRRERVLREYTDPDSPGFGNGTAATLLAYPNMTRPSANSHGVRVIAKAAQDGSLDRWTQEYRDNTRVRIKKLESIALGEYEHRSVIHHTDAKGELTHSQTTEGNPAPMAVVQANNVLAKLDGTYAQQAITRDAISAEYRSIVDKQRRELNRGRKPKKSKA